MDIAAVIRKYGSTVLGLIGVALWLVALYLLASAAQNSAEFNRWLPWILLVNISGLVTLGILLAVKLARLVQDYRRHVPGSRLKGRTVAIFSALAVAPILVVYYFSLQFINRGIDSWFELEVSQVLRDTRELSHAALEVRVREFLQHTQVVAHTLSHSSDFELIATLDRERRESSALEFIASRTIDAEALDPLQVNAGAAVLHGAIGAPDPEHIFGAGRSCDGALSGLMFHRAWFP